MAKAIVNIPDGLFCSDKSHLDCLFADHTEHTHWCDLYRCEIGELETFKSEGCLRRARRKCNKCLEAMIADCGRGLNVDDA